MKTLLFLWRLYMGDDLDYKSLLSRILRLENFPSLEEEIKKGIINRETLLKLLHGSTGEPAVHWLFGFSSDWLLHRAIYECLRLKRISWAHVSFEKSCF